MIRFIKIKKKKIIALGSSPKRDYFLSGHLYLGDPLFLLPSDTPEEEIDSTQHKAQSLSSYFPQNGEVNQPQDNSKRNDNGTSAIHHRGGNHPDGIHHRDYRHKYDKRDSGYRKDKLFHDIFYLTS